MAHTKSTAHKGAGGLAPILDLARKATRKAPRTTAGKSIAGIKPRVSTRTPTSVKKPRRARPRSQTLRDIRKGQKITELLLPKAPFQHLVMELSSEIFGSNRGIHWQASAIEALQECAEAYLVNTFEITNLLCIHAKRVTVMAKDMNLCQLLRSMDMFR